CAALFGDDDEENDAETTGHSAEDQAEIDRQQKEYDEKEAAKEEKEAPEEEPAEESDDVDVVEEENEEETEDKEDSEEETKNDKKKKYEFIDGIYIFTYTNISVIYYKNQLSNFSIKMTDLLVDQHDQIDNGAVFRTISTIEDNKSNQETVYTAQVYYTQDTIDEINYD